ncbi:urease accessory protein UreE [Salipiger aestuarii]|uniref:Urease accessory protein n=1 Tax=Salipiger aestuarii TaxID=568098 RepID=A0A327XVJ7_9RHOB|nr:urease accessory protein UreE [Salipiger aestuarii]EIE49657.1 urease accessory protein UreE [Citreicella sp. 357]KAA8605334.1 urease accessory protein UreE [Salipiger aestuarii]KAA8607866.1 urease accessory protein UreE [Salipiger aestuarii]KAB2538681.1 urease accessory protein UreE [Salipiger aestuarii]RAK12342.1 urease accessory protein [Salipiger aestuarii]
MRMFTDILGKSADFHDALHHLEHHHAVDVLRLPPADLARRRLRCVTEAGHEIAVALPRDTPLYDGAVLALDDAGALVVRVETERWLRLAAANSAVALRLGYLCGNLHWRVRFDGEELLVAIETEDRVYHDRLAPMIEAGEIIVLPAREGQPA